MANPVIKIKRSAVAGKIPNITSLPTGEFAINTNDGKVFIQQDQGVGIGSTIIVVNPWSVGPGTNTYNTYFTAGSVGIGTTNLASKLSVVGDANFTGVITALSFSGNASSATYATTSGVSTSVSGGTANVTSLTLPNSLFSSGVTTTSSTSEVSIDSFDLNTYRSAKYQVQITRGSEYEITEIFIVHDNTNSYGTEYATVRTGSILSSFNTDILSGNVRLLATPSSASSTTFKLVRTLIQI